MQARKLSLAARIVPSRLNSITACALSIAASRPFISALWRWRSVISLVLALAQAFPELAVVVAGLFLSTDKQAVVLADDLFAAVAHRSDKPLFGFEHDAAQV
jgi:hypothetical protein